MSESTAIEVRRLELAAPDTQAMLDRVSVELQMAESIIIDSQAMLDEATEMAGRLATVERAIEAERLERGKPVREMLDWLNQGYSSARDYVAERRGLISGRLAAYSAEQRRIAAEAEAKARAEAASAAAAAEAEARAKAAALADEAGRAMAQGDAAAAFELSAAASQASASADAARSVQAVTRPSFPTKKVKGAREVWSAEVVSLPDLADHLVSLARAGDSSLLVSLLQVNQSSLNAMARASKSLLRLPGVRVVSTESVSVRGVAV